MYMYYRTYIYLIGASFVFLAITLINDDWIGDIFHDNVFKCDV